jgi:very-short-patch-repair endonuclease
LNVLRTLRLKKGWEQFSFYYLYDKIGNLVQDKKEHISKIEWTVYGKVREVIPEQGHDKHRLGFASNWPPSNSPLTGGRTVLPADGSDILKDLYIWRVNPGGKMVRLKSQENFYYGASQELIDRARGLRHNMTDAERVLWNILRRKQLNGYRFRRQHPIARFIVDFLCFKAKLIIELDGGVHQNPEQKEYDENRTHDLEELGFRVVRFQNEEVLFSPQEVINTIEKLISESPDCQ